MLTRVLSAVALSVCLTTVPCTAAQGLAVFHIGNSLTDETYEMHTIAADAGYTWPGVIYARSMIPGCPLWLLWSENVAKTADKSTGNAGFFLEVTGLNSGEEWIESRYPSLWTPTLYLNAKPFDVVVMQVFPENGDSYNKQETVAGAIGYPGEAYKPNPNCQAYIYPSHTMDVGSKCDLTEYTRIYEPIARAVTAAYPNRKPALVIPVLQVWNQMMDAGYTDLWLNATDGHANDMGKYILCVTFYATLYKRNPAGATFGGFSVTQAFATKAQEVAWSVVQSYPLSGVAPVSVREPAKAGSVATPRTSPAHRVNLAGRTTPGAMRQSTLVLDGLLR